MRQYLTFYIGGKWVEPASSWSGLLPTLPLPFAEVPDLHGNGAPARDRTDPSYRRPLLNLRALTR